MLKMNIKILAIILVSVLVLSCSGVKVPASATLEERMDTGMRLFEKGKFFEAKTQFRIITLSHSGSVLADKAQFYLGECHFNMKEYILAASEYERLIKVYPSSEYVDDAKYKLGLSYYELSPKYSLDQEYTRQAIMHFQEFLEDFHSSSLVAQVEDYLQLARDKLAHKVFSSAEIYRKMHYYQAATIYYSKVLEEYYDTSYAPKALYWLGECNRRLEKYQAAMLAFDEFLNKYPKHEWNQRVKNKIRQTRQEVIKNQQTAKADGKKKQGTQE